MVWTPWIPPKRLFEATVDRKSPGEDLSHWEFQHDLYDNLEKTMVMDLWIWLNWHPNEIIWAYFPLPDFHVLDLFVRGLKRTTATRSNLSTSMAQLGRCQVFGNPKMAGFDSCWGFSWSPFWPHPRRGSHSACVETPSKTAAGLWWWWLVTPDTETQSKYVFIPFYTRVPSILHHITFGSLCDCVRVPRVFPCDLHPLQFKIFQAIIISRLPSSNQTWQLTIHHLYLEQCDFPLKAPFTSGISQLAIFDDTGGYLKGKDVFSYVFIPLLSPYILTPCFTICLIRFFLFCQSDSLFTFKSSFLKPEIPRVFPMVFPRQKAAIWSFDPKPNASFAHSVHVASLRLDRLPQCRQRPARHAPGERQRPWRRAVDAGADARDPLVPRGDAWVPWWRGFTSYNWVIIGL